MLNNVSLTQCQMQNLPESTLVDQYASNNRNKIFKYIKRFLKSHNLPVTLYLDHNPANSDLEKASLLNTFFESAYSKSNVSPAFDTIPQFSGQDQLDIITISDI